MGGGSNLSFLVLSLASLLAVWHHANVVQESASILDKLYTLNFWLPSLSVMHWLPPLVTKLVLQTRKIASLLLASLSLLRLWSALRKKLQINKESHLIIVPSSKFELFSRNVLLLSSVLGPQVVLRPQVYHCYLQDVDLLALPELVLLHACWMLPSGGLNESENPK